MGTSWKGWKCMVLSVGIVVVACLGVERTHNPKTEPAQAWLAFNPHEHRLWVNGFLQGLIDAHEEMANKGASCSDFAATEGFPLRAAARNEHKVVSAMTDLYQDPANAQFSWNDMLALSIRKVNGEDIEPELRAAREKLRALSR